MTIYAIKAKHWVLRHYLWVALGLLVLALAVAFRLQPETVQQWVGLIGVPAIVLVTLQKQKTEELQLFKGGNVGNFVRSWRSFVPNPEL